MLPFFLFTRKALWLLSWKRTIIPDNMVTMVRLFSGLSIVVTLTYLIGIWGR